MTITAIDAGPRKVCRSAVVAAAPEELFEIVAHPREHHELDGSGTVGTTITGPERLSEGAHFTTHMKQRGVPYRITSRVVAFDEGRLIEWRHPLGHHWRWEFAPEPAGGSNGTRVTETFDYSPLGRVRSTYLRIIRVPRQNARGIEATLENLQRRYAK